MDAERVHTNRHSKCSRLGRKPFVYLEVRLATSCGPATSDAETFEGTFAHDHSVTKVLRISPSCMFHEPADGRKSCRSNASSLARLSRPLHEVQTKDERRTGRAKETTRPEHADAGRATVRLNRGAASSCAKSPRRTHAQRRGVERHRRGRREQCGHIVVVARPSLKGD